MSDSLYPGQLDTDASLYRLVNSTALTLQADIGTGDTTISVLPDTTGLPEVGIALIGHEIVKYTGLTLNELQGVTRGFSGTDSAPHTVGDTVIFAYFAEHHNTVKDAVLALQAVVGITDGDPTSLIARVGQTYRDRLLSLDGTTDVAYDAEGRPETLTTTLPGNITRVSTLTYDADGNVSTVVTEIAALSLSETQTITRDGSGKVTHIEFS